MAFIIVSNMTKKCNVDGVFVPNKKYKLQQELDNLKANVKPGHTPTEECNRTFYGATYLLDTIGGKTGITQDLKTSVPDDYKEIQINLALLYGEKSGLPVYYRKLPGNITDKNNKQSAEGH